MGKKAVFANLPMWSLNEKPESRRTPRFQTDVEGIIMSPSKSFNCPDSLETDLEPISITPSFASSKLKQVVNAGGGHNEVWGVLK